MPLSLLSWESWRDAVVAAVVGELGFIAVSTMEAVERCCAHLVFVVIAGDMLEVVPFLVVAVGDKS